MFDKNSAISFSTFYMLEFFRRTLEQGSGKIPEEQYEMLEELSGFISGKEDVLPGLEQLAQYAGTNELSIFLFDLSERINSYSYSLPSTIKLIGHLNQFHRDSFILLNSLWVI